MEGLTNKEEKMICVKKRMTNTWIGIGSVVDGKFKTVEIEKLVPPDAAKEMIDFIDVIRAAGDTAVYNLKKRILEGSTADPEEMFIDWFNNFASVETFAEYYGISEERAWEIITEGRAIHLRDED